MKIWKHDLKMIDSQDVLIPRGSKILTAQIQRGELQLWFACNESENLERRRVHVVGTGNPMPDNLGEYISTFQLYGGDLVFHVFVEEAA